MNFCIAFSREIYSSIKHFRSFLKIMLPSNLYRHTRSLMRGIEDNPCIDNTVALLMKDHRIQVHLLYIGVGFD